MAFKKVIVLREKIPITRDEAGITAICIYNFGLKDNSLEL